MLSFALSGTLHCVLTTTPDELTLVISSPLVEPVELPRLAWILCTARDSALRAAILCALRPGDLIRVEGHIEQRRRQVGELAFHSVAFIAKQIERLPPPPEGGAP